MLIKSVTILCLIALARAATIQRDIPVEVIYEERASEGISVENLGEKVQLSAKELKEAITNEIQDGTDQKPVDVAYEKADAVKNLDEKIQLSPEELTQALKHIPTEGHVEEAAPLKALGELPKIEEVTQEPDGLNFEGVLQQAEEIISSGLKKLRVSFKPDKDQLGPNAAQWENLEKAVNEYLNEEKTKLQLKQQQPAQPGQPPQNQGFFQNIANGIQTIANNFVQNLSTQNTNITNQGDEQQGGNQGGFQGFVSFFQGGINNIANSIGSLGGQGSTTSNTVLGDPGTGATTQAPGFISSIVSNVQQFFGQIQGGNQIGTSGTQGDTGVSNATASGPQGPVQVIQSIGTAINQFIQGNRPPGTSGDEGTATTEAGIIQSIGNVFQNSPLNPFRPPQAQKPGDPVSQNPIQAGVQNVQNQIQQLVPGQSSTEAAKQPEDQIAVEQNNQVVEEIPATKGVSPGDIKEESAEKEKMEEKNGIKQPAMQQNLMEEEIKREEIMEEMKQEEMKEEIMKEEMKQEEIKQEIMEEAKEEMKQEEIKQEIMEEAKEEMKQEEIKQEIMEEAKEEMKQEIMKEAKEETKEKVEEKGKQDEIKKEEKKEEDLMTAE